MESKDFNEKIIVSSDRMIGSWAAIFILMVCFFIGLFINYNMPKMVLIVVIPISFLFSVFVPSYFFLNQVFFYTKYIEKRYLIKHFSKKKLQINVEDIVAFRFIYTGGKGSGGNGTLKVFYKENNHNKIIRCSMDKLTAMKLHEQMTALNKIFEMDIR